MKQENEGLSMTPNKFRNWRKSLGLKQKDAAELLGLKKRMIQYYEKGERGGKSVDIPLYVRLACYAVGQGVRDFDGEKEFSGRSEQNKATRTGLRPTIDPDANAEIKPKPGP